MELEVIEAFVSIFASQGISAVVNALGLADAAKSVAEKRLASDEKSSSLEELVADFDWSKAPPEDRETIQRYCEQKRANTSTGSLFSDEDVEAVVQEYFRQHPDAFPNKEEIAERLREFMLCYDYELRQHMTEGEQVLYHQEKVGQSVSHREHQEISEKLDQLGAKLESSSSSKKEEMFTANEMYADAFQRMLFLHHKENPADREVTLANLYVTPRYEEIRRDKTCDLPTRLARFVQVQKDDSPRILLIEGDAGSGKTTLVEWLNYQKRKHTQEAATIFQNRSLVTIRLRDLDKALISKDKGLFVAIQAYMKLPDEKALAHQFEEAVFVLDGFDELCMIEQITDHARLIDDFERRIRPWVPAKIIITSRPQYINALRSKHEKIILLHFNEGQRDQWLTNYKEKCKQYVAPHIETYIKQMDGIGESAIFDTPMALYMIAARNLDAAALKNSWKLYHDIFYEDIRDTEYNAMTENPEHEFSDISHPASGEWDLYYQISEEIAYWMYKNQNSRLYVDSEQLKEILLDLEKQYPKLKNESVREITKRCHVLCCFWKNDTEEGALEFYHNNIRDFFLCEKIYREVNRIYHRGNWDDKEIVLRFVDFFQHHHLEEQVCQFVEQRSACGKDRTVKFCEKDFPAMEYNQRNLPDFFQLMVTDGSLFLQTEYKGKVYPGVFSKNPMERILNVLSSVVNLYDLAYLPYLKEKETFSFWNNMQEVEMNGLLRYLFLAKPCRIYLSRVNLNGANLSEANLSGADLSGADLQNAILCGANLHKADLYKVNLYKADLSKANLSKTNLRAAYLIRTNLSYSDLRHAILRGADLREADLREADLREADLRGADLREADLREADLREADLREADLCETDLRGANLDSVNLHGSNLRKANLHRADLCNADLRNVTLPDGFISNDQQEQVTQLKSMVIFGLRI